MLAAVERALEDEPFVAIGVHSPKFPNERDPEMVREAVRRYGVTHPVVVDSGMRIWQRYGVNAWPTLVLVDAEGEIAGAGSGEPDADALLAAVRRVIDEGRRRGTLRGAPLPLRREASVPGSLAYPGKVIADDSRVFVADTGHDQIVVCDADGAERYRIGSGEPGLVEGSREAARFRHPNGMALARDTLYVADTGNHAVRAVDLRRGAVSTVARSLRSPWDIACDGTLLYVAMAGSHQIHAYELGSHALRRFAGTGYERCVDGPAGVACFAQPSGLVLDGGVLYVADSEVSSVRAIDDLHGSPAVRTVCGSGELFGFGDRDGISSAALLQHPMGIAAGGGRLFVADTFNHKVKVVDPASGECRTLFGDGTPERLAELVPGKPLRAAAAGEPAFFEPDGLAWREGELLVADTNNHRVLAVSIADGARRVLVGE